MSKFSNGVQFAQTQLRTEAPPQPQLHSGPSSARKTRKKKKVKPPPTQRQGLKLQRQQPYSCPHTDETPCCSRNCFEQFSTAAIDEYRRCVQALPADQRRQRIKEYHSQNLLVSDGLADCSNKRTPCCMSYLLGCFSISRSWYYPPAETKRKDRDCPKTTSVLAWFLQVKETADIMPDAQSKEALEEPEVVYQIPQSKKNDVFLEYLDDCEKLPALYLPCDESLFLKVWREYFPNVKLRKYLRFAKCSFCTTNRELRKDPSASSECKAKCKVEMQKHWQWIAMERGGELRRQHQAVLTPGRPHYHTRCNGLSRPSQWIPVLLTELQKRKRKEAEAPHNGQSQSRRWDICVRGSTAHRR